jgi:PAS domain S-box-containing protein
VRDTLAPHFEDGGRLTGWEGVLTDVTAQRVLADDLRTTSMLHVLVANLPAGVVFVQGAAGRPLLVNARARHLLGRREDSGAGLDHLVAVYRLERPDGSPYPVDELPVALALRRGLATMRDDIVVHRPDGRRLPLITWAAPLDLSGQGHDAAVWVFEDLSAVRQAESARHQTLAGLRASEERYRRLVETLPLALLQFDPGLRLTYANPATESLTGYRLDELAEPARWQALIHPDDLPRLLAALTEGEPASDAGLPGTSTLEVRIRPRDGSDRIGFAILQPPGAVPGVTALVVDVTRERHLEQELLRSQRVELVGRLAGGLAHDFNNLLAVILSFAHLARTRMPADHPARKDLHAISTAAEQASNLAGQLLTFGKQRQLTPRRVDLNKVVRHTLELVRGTLPATVEVSSEVGPEELPVMGDETQLQQVVLNLCLNARDAMPAGGRLTVQATAATDQTGRWARLSVRDTGEGMSDEVRQGIFVPFFSTKERGTGLGLAVVKQIVEAHGGRIDVGTRQGEGSCFEVWVPLAQT